jgi:hypothetical protein
MDLGAVILAGIMMSIKGLGIMVAAFVVLLITLTVANVRYSRRPWMSVPVEYINEIKIIRWGCLLFLLSEGCSLTSMLLNLMYFEGLYFSFISSLLSASSLALLFYAAFVMVDRSIGSYATKKCFAYNRCNKKCPVTEDGDKCKIRGMLFMFALFVIFASFFPFLVPLKTISIDAASKMLPFIKYNDWFDERIVPGLLKNIPTYVPGLVKYRIPFDLFLIEYRLIPAIAFLISLSSLAFIFSYSERLALKMLVVSAGLMIYPYIEIVFYSASRDMLKGALAFETVEFLLMFCVLLSLRCIYPPVEIEAFADDPFGLDDEDGEEENGEGSGEEDDGEEEED